MPIIDLNVKKLQALKSASKRLDYFDASLPGFAVRVSVAGRKTFIVFYRHAGRLRRYTLGTYPPLSLADARDEARKALRNAALGSDPVTVKYQAREAGSFQELAAEYLKRHAKPNKKSWREDERLIDKHLLPIWKNVKAQEISRKDIRGLLDELVVNTPILANRVRALISKMFNWAISRDLLESNPCQHIPRPAQAHQRQRVLNEGEIRTLWTALNVERLVTASSFRLRLLTAQRANEIFGMRWDEVEGDWWTIPSERAKNGLVHRVPLSPQTMRIIKELKSNARDGLPWVLPAICGRGHLVSVQKAAARLRENTGINFCGHDLRRTAASFMTSMGVPRLTVSKILNHVESGITSVYDRHSYDKEKREALNQWGRRLQTIVSGLRDVSVEPRE